MQHHSTSTSDFTSTLRGTKQIRAGSTTATISIDTSDDSIYEGDESFVLHITSITGVTPSNLSARGSIEDNDTPSNLVSLSLEQIAITATEGASFTYRLELNRASAADVTFAWSVEHISTSASDFTGATSGLNKLISAGETSTTITIQTSDDSIYEGDESFVLHITSITGAASRSLSASGRIIDNDPQPSILFEPVATTEGASLIYTLRLTNTSTTDITFAWSVEHISTSASDFTGATSGLNKLISAGETSTTISIDTSDDSIYEGDESFVLRITSVTGAASRSLSASGRIIDNDLQPSILFEPVATTEGASLIYTLRLTNTSTTDVTFGWYVEHISTSASDFTGATSGLNKLISAGETSTTISIDTSDDSIYEGDESFVLRITSVTGAASRSLSTSGRIIDNDPQPSILFEPVATTEGASLIYTLRLTNTSTTDVTFAWYVEHISTSTSDFTGATSGLNKLISAGDTTTTISIDTSDDSIYETDEIFTLNIINVIGATPGRLEAGGRIIDNDAQPIIEFKQIVDSTALEGTSLSYSLQLNTLVDVDVTFDWSLQHISTSTSDFRGATSESNNIISAGDTTATIVLQINDDRRPEQAEEFTLNITNIRGATPDSLSAFITILENDLDTTVDYNGNGLIDIVTQEQLGNIRYNLAGESYKTSVSDVGKTCGGNACRGYELLANLDLSAFANWQPIGSQNDPFTSILQGNGYSIANLAISGSNYLGLFAALSGATIDNLVVEVASISGDSYVGALAGRAENSAISRVQIRAVDVNSKLSARGGKVGGMLGATIGTTITNITSDLSIVGGNNDNADYAGGIVGYVSSSDISYAYSSGSVFVTGSDPDNVGGLVGYMQNYSAISYSSASSSVTSNGSDSWAYGGLVGRMKNNSTISYSSASGSVTSNGDENSIYGGLVGELDKSTISDSSASGSVISNGDENAAYGGLVGRMRNNSAISTSSASGSVTSNEDNSDYYGGLVGYIISASDISSSSASGSVSSSGVSSDYYGGLIGGLNNAIIRVSTSSASGSVTSNEDNSDYYGGLVGIVRLSSVIRYSSASGSVSASGVDSDYYGGLVGESDGEVQHSWSSSSVFASNPAGLVGNNTGNLKFSYALGDASYGLVATNTGTGTITNSYWNSETSGALEAVDAIDNTINIASSNTAGMLASTGSAGASVFADFADATDKLSRKIWTFASGNYPVITELGVDKQAVALAYGLLRLASPYVGVSNLDSFLGGTLNNENIELIANSYNADDILAILDVNLLQSNSATCTAGSGDTIMTTTGANGTTIALQKIAGSIEIEKSPSNSCDIIFSNQKTDGTLQLAALISKGTASLSKKFEITLNTIQSRISLQPPTRSTREGDELVFTLELNHRARRDIIFDWSVQHSSTSASDFTGAISGLKTILAEGTDATIMLQINDDDRPEQAENFTLNITNIRGVTHNNLSASITILENDLDITVDYNDNGLIDIVTQEHLDNIRYNLAGTSYKTSASDVGKTCGGNACSGYELLGNLDLSTFANWQPIGSQNDPFTNILQGNGYSIANLAIDGGDYLGLFAALSGATIDNLVVEVASISGDSYVGALAGRAENSAISRVQIRAVDVNSKLSARGGKVGGMLGATIGTTITNITSDLSIVGGNNDNADYAGGIVGYVSSSDISYAYSSGSVFVTGSDPDNVGGLVGYMQNYSAISYSSASSSVTSNGSDSWAYGGLVGRMKNNSTISYSSASGSVTSNGDENSIYGGLVGELDKSTISDSSASGSVISNGDENAAYGGLVGRMRNNSAISTSSASGSVTSNEDNSDYYGGLVGYIISASDISSSSASGSVSSNGINSDYYGGLIGGLNNAIIRVSTSSASGSVTSNEDNSDYYGGLVGIVRLSSVIRYSSASGSVSASGVDSDYYGGLVGESDGEVQHSWSSSSVFASNPAGLVGNNTGNLKFSYALGDASYGLVATNTGTGTITNSYWNSETSGALTASQSKGTVTNIASSNTAGMLASTGSAGASVFADFADATDKLSRKIWTFASGNYPVITELGVDKQAVALAYGLLRLASPYVGVSNLDSFLGGTLNNENIELIANSYNTGSTLAILDINLLQSNSATCVAGSTDIILTTTGANGTTIALQKIAGSIEIEKSPSNSCDIIFSNSKTDGTLQLAAIISKGTASLSKKFEITLNAIQSIISLQPPTLSTSEGDELVFTLELNHRASRDLSFDWFVQHISTSTSDFTGAISGSKTILAEGTDATIRLQINDADRPEQAENFTLNITNIRGVIHNNLSASITILENDLTVDYNGNGLIDIVTQEQLGNIRYNLAGTSYKIDDSGASMNCNGNICRGYELLGNLDLSAFANWQPIGSQNDPFTSILQGNGYSIANLAIDRGNNIGLFAELSGATIDNLVVEVASISGDSYVGALAGRAENSAISRIQIRAASASSKLSATGANIGGILGAITHTTITNVTSDLDVVGIGGAGLVGLGGIVGYVEDSNISYAYSSASVSAGSGADRVGGLAGAMENNSAISYSSASGSVSSRGTRNYAYGGLVGYMNTNSDIHYSSASGSVTSSGDRNVNYGGLVGYSGSSNISYSSASGSVSSSGDRNYYYGGLVGRIESNSTISDSSTSASVTSNGYNNSVYGGLVGRMSNSTISYSSASASVSSTGDEGNKYGGLAGEAHDNSKISYSSASGSVSSSGASSGRYGGLAGELINSTISDSSASGNVISDGDNSNRYGGLAGMVKETSKISNSSASGNVISNGISHTYGGLSGLMENDSTIDHSSASGSVTSNEDNSDYYGGLVGIVRLSSVIRYSSASGSVSASGVDSDYYGGLVGESDGEVQHSWSSSSVFASNPAGLVGNNTGNLKFSYALGDASYGLVATNTGTGTITNSYWNSETSGALEAVDAIDNTINIASSNTAGMLASTGSAGASVFADFADATDKLSRKIWTFASGNYPVIEEIGVDKQAVSLAYGLLRLANPYVSNSTLGSFLGATLNNEDIELIANSYNANDTLAILDVNLLQSNSATCAADSTDTILTTTGANGTTIALQKIAGSIEIEKKAGNSCDIIFSNSKTDGTLQLAALISKGTASLSKKFEITLNTIQSRISLQPPTLSTSEGDELVFTLELNHRARRDIIFDWSVQHISTSTSDFTGAISGSKTILAEGTDATIRLQINDADRPEQAEDFTLNITNIRGVIHNNLSASITILENDLTVDYNGNGLIDIVTQEQLGNIRYNLAGTSYKIDDSGASMNCNGNACRGYELLANLDLSVFTNWQPIGSQNNPFTSILQGNGYSIANLAISGSNYLGLFAALSGATIDNLVIEVVSIAGDSYVGALAGRAEQSTISRVQIRAVDVNSKLQATGEKVGGMLGETIGTTITNVISDLSIVGGNNDNADYVGGIVGYVSSSDISYAYSSSSVSASDGADNVGGLVGYMQNNSAISYSSASSSVTSNGSDSWAYGGLVGRMKNNSTISYSSASGSVTSNGDENSIYGGLVGELDKSTISDSSASGSVISNGDENAAYGGLVGRMRNNSAISTSSASGSVTSNEDNSDYYGGLVGYIISASDISSSSASGSVSSSGVSSDYYGGLIGGLNNAIIRVSTSSASGSVTSNEDNSDYYGGLVGIVRLSSVIRYSSASGSVSASGVDSDYYGGLVGESDGEVQHSWSSSSVFASNPAGLVGNNTGNLKFSYALGDASYGLVATNTGTGTITNSYWNSETSGALEAVDAIDNTINIASSNTAGMLASTGSAGASVFADFADATDKLSRKIWTFASGNYPVITELGVDKQAVALAYGLLRLASPYVGVSNLDSFLGGTLNNENIELIANSYNADDILAILDVNLLQSNSATCTAGSGDTIMTTTGANGTTIALQKIAGSIEIEKSPSNSCDIIFSNQKTDGTLQLAALISKGTASLSKKFEITLNTIQSRISLQPPTRSTREGDELVFTLELNHRARRDIIFDWSVQHSSTSASDFTGAISGSKTIFTKDTDVTIALQINDDNRPEQAENFTLNITNIRGVIHNNLSASITILENDLTVDYNGNGLIDIVTQEQLGNIRYNLAGTSYKIDDSGASMNCNGNDCRGYELLANLDLSSFANWQPIGSENDPFTSILQGNGYSITNLVIDGGNFATDDRDYLGLFAVLSGATIDNLVVEVVSITGDSDVGALAGSAENSAISRVQIRAASASSKLSAIGARIGGILGRITDTTITNATSDLDVVGIGGISLAGLGGIVGYAGDSSISHAYSSASISAGNLFHSAGGLVGFMTNSRLSYSSASGSVSGGGTNEHHGGLVGYMESSSVSYSSASGSVISSGQFGQNHGGLVGYMESSSVSYSSASGSVIDIDAAFSFFYGGLVGYTKNSGKIIHSWSSSSVRAVVEGSYVAGLIGSNEIDVKFNYVLGVILPSGFGFVDTNSGTITNSYWNSETSGALEAGPGSTTNIASSDTAGMLASTGSAEARIFKGFFDATDEHNRNIWSFASGSYPIITELGVDKQAVSLAYGLLRLASPNVGVSNLDSFLGGTLHNENIVLDVADYNANDTLAILDVNLLQSNSATCATGSTDSIITTTGANQAVVTLSVTSATNNLQERIVYTGCSIGFDGAAVIQAGDRLQLVATITKGLASLTKKFIINFR